MDVEMKSTQRMVSIVAKLLIIIMVSLVIYRFYDNDFDVFASLSGVAAIAVAYLTIAYVSTTSHQLNVMRQQLLEIKKSRELTDQPLPIVKIKKMHLKKPSFYYTPPTGEYSWQSIAHLEISVRNISNYPAVNVCIYPTIFVDEGDNQFALTEYAEFYDILAQEPSDKKFIITEDVDGKLAEALTSRNKPKLMLKVLYKNILGSSFLSEHFFDIRAGHVKKLDMETYKKGNEVLNNWHSKINEFESDFRNEIVAIKTLTPHKSEEWRNMFDNIKKRFVASLDGDGEFLLDTIVDSSKYNISVISNEIYVAEVEGKRDL